MNSAVFYIIFFGIVGVAWVGIGLFYMWRKNNSVGRSESLQFVLKNIPVGILEINANGDFELYNHVAEDLLAIEKNNLGSGHAKVDIFNAVSPSNKEITKKRNPFWRATHRWQPIRNEVVGLRHTNGKMVWLQVSSEPVYTEEGNINSAFISFMNVTRRVEQDNLIKTQQDALYRASRMSSIGILASGVAHEINNPMTVISGLADISRMKLEKLKNPPLDILQRLEKIDGAVARVVRIIKGLRSLTASDISEPLEPTQVKDTLTTATDLCGSIIRSYDIDLKIDCDENATINCRPADLTQAIINLLTNATDAVKGLEEKWINVEVSSSNGKVEIAITDSGSGISPESAEQFLLPFYTTKPPNLGGGLGLTLAQQIVNEHSGKLCVDHENKNTSFVIKLDSAEILDCKHSGAA